MDISAIRAATECQDQGGAELRSAPRFSLLIRSAKLISPQGEFICVIRDISTTGVSVHLFHPLPKQDPIALELQSGEQHDLIRVWEKGSEAGFEFPENVSVDRFVSEVGSFPKRGLRLGILFPVTVKAMGQRYDALVENISQQGARLTCDELFAIDQTLTINGEGLDEVCAKVRWRGNGGYGVVFDDTFGLSEFARLAVNLQAPVLLEV